MPLPIPLICAAVVLAGGVIVHVTGPDAPDGGDTVTPHDPLPYQIAYARRRMAARLTALGVLKLNIWRVELPGFVRLYEQHASDADPSTDFTVGSLLLIDDA
ncbi:MAG: hypothetical protein AAFV53_17755, partial [Myxococcota bacterium]